MICKITNFCEFFFNRKKFVKFEFSIYVGGDRPRPMNTLAYNVVADSFHTKKLCNRLSSSDVRISMENGRFAFLRSLWGRATYAYDESMITH